MEQHVGEVVNNIPFLNTSADVMDARATVMQENARIAERVIVDTVTNNSGDFDGLANALGETAPHEVIPVVSAPQQFNIGTPRERERSPRGRGKGRGSKNTVSGALAAIAIEKQTVPENVDAGIAPIARKRTGRHGWDPRDPTARTQNNFSPQLTADQTNIMLSEHILKQQAGRLATQDGEPDAKKTRQLTLNEVGVKGSAPRVIKRPEPVKDIKQTTLKDAFTKGAKPKTISQEPSLTKDAPKLANESSTEEVKGKPAEMPQFSGSLTKQQIVDKYLEFFNDDKSVKSLIAMTKANLLIYVQSKVPVQADKTDKLVKTTTLKPGKGRTQGRNKGVTA